MLFPRWTLSTSSQMRARPSSRPSTFRIMPETSALVPSPGMASGRFISCQPPAIIPASSQQIARAGRRRLSGKADGGLRAIGRETPNRPQRQASPAGEASGPPAHRARRMPAVMAPTWARIRRSGIRRMMVFSSPFRRPLIRMPPVSDQDRWPVRHHQPSLSARP